MRCTAAYGFRLGGAAFAVALAGATGANAQDGAVARSAVEWLHAMDSAWRKLDYEGEFSYYTSSPVQVELRGSSGSRTFGLSKGIFVDRKVATFRIVHKVVDGVEHERIVHLGGPRREILRKGSAVRYVLEPGDEFAPVGDAMAQGPHVRLFMRSLDISANYTIGISGRDEVVGRGAVCIEVTPFDEDRYGHLLWLDESTGLLLRSELRDANGTHLEKAEFESLRIGDDVAMAELDPALSEGSVVWDVPERRQPPAQARRAIDWHVGWLPTGFRLTNTRSHHPGQDAVQVVFSDGLASFSVFIENAQRRGAGNVMRSGATVVLSRNLPEESGDYRVTVVGEVPPPTAQRIATSVQREP